MADPQGLFRFPGIDDFETADYTLSHGISPGVCTVVMPVQTGFQAQGGTMRFTFGSVSLEFRDCKIDRASFRMGADGKTWTLAILDRRWKWAWGEISGVYNTRFANGDVDPEREKTPQELAELCLKASS